MKLDNLPTPPKSMDSTVQVCGLTFGDKILWRQDDLERKEPDMQYGGLDLFSPHPLSLQINIPFR